MIIFVMKLFKMGTNQPDFFYQILEGDKFKVSEICRRICEQ